MGPGDHSAESLPLAHLDPQAVKSDYTILALPLTHGRQLGCAPSLSERGAQGAGRDWSPGMKLLDEGGWAPPDPRTALHF